MNEIQDRIKHVIIKAMRLNHKTPADIIGKNLPEELGISSVDALEILIGIETEFDITIHDEDLNQNLIASCDSLQHYIEKQLACASA